MLELGRIPLFANLSPGELEKLTAVSVFEAHDAGTLLLEQGKKSADVYVLLRGTVRVFATHDGEEEYYTTLSVGSVFGEIGVLREQPRSASVRAEGPVRVLRIPGIAFRRLTDEHEGIGELVLETMFGRFRADEARARARQQRRRTSSRIVPFVSATGGAGTSLVLANVAAFLRELTGERVLAVDLDLMFGDLAPLFGIEDGPTISDLLMDPHLEAESVDAVTHEVSQGVQVIPAPSLPEDAEFVQPGFLERFLDSVVDRYDWILCDTTDQVGDMTLELLDRATMAVYVATPDLTSVRNASRWFDLIERVGVRTDGMRVVANKVEDGDEVAVGYLRQRFGDAVLPELPLDVDAAKSAVNAGTLLAEAGATSPLAQALRRVAGALVGLELDDPSEEATPFWKRWL